MIKFFPIILIALSGCTPNIVKEKRISTTKQSTIRTINEDIDVEQQYNDFFQTHSEWWVSFCDYMKTHPEVASKMLALFHSQNYIGALYNSLCKDTSFTSNMADIILLNSVPLASHQERAITGVYLRKKHGSSYWDIPMVGWDNINNNVITIEPRKVDDFVEVVVQYNEIVGLFPAELGLDGVAVDYEMTCYFDLERVYFSIKKCSQKKLICLVIGEDGGQIISQQIKFTFKCILGDINGNEILDNNDRNLIIENYGQALNENNFKCDINMDGQITESDLKETYIIIPESDGMKIKIK